MNSKKNKLGKGTASAVPLYRNWASALRFQPVPLATDFMRGRPDHEILETCAGVARQAARPQISTSIPCWELLNRAANVRENVVGVRADEPDRSHHDHQNHSQHHRVLSDVLTALITPKVLQKFGHGLVSLENLC